MPPARIASVHYLNARPLVRGFTHGLRPSRIELVQASPARCAQCLESGSVDVALIPSIEYLRIPGLTVLPGMAIASPREARSVLLISRVAAPEIRSAALDASSRTSAALLRILLSRRSRHPVAYREMEPDLERMLQHCDAALLIGDAALRASAAGLRVYDLAAEWYAMTGLPFVFAFWAVRPGFDPRESLQELHDSAFVAPEPGDVTLLSPALPELPLQGVRVSMDPDARVGTGEIDTFGVTGNERLETAGEPRFLPDEIRHQAEDRRADGIALRTALHRGDVGGARTADAVGPLEQGDTATAPLEIVRGDQAIDPGADDDHP